MPLAHESKLLKELEEKKKHKALKDAYEAAKPFLRHWMRERDRIHLTKGACGTHVEFPFFVGGEGLWGIKLPWNHRLLQADAVRHVEEMVAAANQPFMDEITGKARPGWLRRLLDRCGFGRAIDEDEEEDEEDWA